MMIGWSKHMSAPEPRIPIDYALASTVCKSGGGTVLVRRDPVPELLIGNPRLLIATLNALQTSTKIRAATLSFHRDDMNAALFNAGDPVLRRRVAQILELIDAYAHAAVPKSARLPFLVSTHTHLGRLELNMLWPRAIIGGHGHVLNYNQHSMRRGAKAQWDAIEDFVNAEFGFADPRDPGRAQMISGPDGIEKQVVAAQRAGLIYGPDKPKHFFVQQLHQLSDHGLSTPDFVKAVAALVDAHGWVRHRHDGSSLTVGPADASVTQKLRLRGTALFGASSAQELENRIKARQEYMAMSRSRLVDSWQARAQESIQTFAKRQWPPQTDPELEIDRILAMPALRLSTHHPDKRHSAKSDRGSAINVFVNVTDYLALHLRTLRCELEYRLQRSRFVTWAIKLTPRLKLIANQLEINNARNITERSPCPSRKPDGQAYPTSRTTARKPREITAQRKDRRDDVPTLANCECTDTDDRPQSAVGYEDPHRQYRSNGIRGGRELCGITSMADYTDSRSRGARLKSARSAAAQAFPGDKSFLRFIKTASDGEVLLLETKAGSIQLTSTSVHVAGGTIDDNAVVAFADALGLQYRWWNDVTSSANTEDPIKFD